MEEKSSNSSGATTPPEDAGVAPTFSPLSLSVPAKTLQLSASPQEKSLVGSNKKTKVCKPTRVLDVVAGSLDEVTHVSADASADSQQQQNPASGLPPKAPVSPIVRQMSSRASRSSQSPRGTLQHQARSHSSLVSPRHRKLRRQNSTIDVLFEAADKRVRGVLTHLWRSYLSKQLIATNPRALRAVAASSMLIWICHNGVSVRARRWTALHAEYTLYLGALLMSSMAVSVAGARHVALHGAEGLRAPLALVRKGAHLVGDASNTMGEQWNRLSLLSALAGAVWVLFVRRPSR